LISGFWYLAPGRTRVKSGRSVSGQWDGYSWYRRKYR